MDRPNPSDEPQERGLVNEDVEFIDFNEWMVQKMVSVDENGVTTRIVLVVRSELHDKQLGLVFHPRAALLLGADMVLVAANE